MTTYEFSGHRFGVSVEQDERQVAVRLDGVLDQEGSSLVALWLTPFVLLEVARPVLVDLTGLTCLHAEGLETLLDLIELAGYRRCPIRFVVGDPDHAASLHLEGSYDRLLANLVSALAPPSGSPR